MVNYSFVEVAIAPKRAKGRQVLSFLRYIPIDNNTWKYFMIEKAFLAMIKVLTHAKWGALIQMDRVKPHVKASLQAEIQAECRVEGF